MSKKRKEQPAVVFPAEGTEVFSAILSLEGIMSCFLGETKAKILMFKAEASSVSGLGFDLGKAEIAVTDPALLDTFEIGQEWVVSFKPYDLQRTTA